MKICYIGNFTLFDSPLGYNPVAQYIAGSFRSVGHEVDEYNEADQEPEALIELIEAEGYDMILTEEARLKGDFKNDGEQDLLLCKFEPVMALGIPVVPWLTNVFMGIKRREDQIPINPIFKADVVFTTDGGHDEEWQRYGVNHVCLRQGIFEPEAYEGKPDYPTTAKVAFIGAIYEEIWPYRKQLVDFLHQKYGQDFEHVGIRGEVRHDDLNRYLATVPVIVGDSVASPKYWSNRIYEILGRGGFLIHPMIEGLETEFKPYEHFVPYAYGDFAGLVEKIDYYLAHPKERERIRKAGFKFCRENYTYARRVETLLSTLVERGLFDEATAFPRGRKYGAALT